MFGGGFGMHGRRLARLRDDLLTHRKLALLLLLATLSALLPVRGAQAETPDCPVDSPSSFWPLFSSCPTPPDGDWSRQRDIWIEELLAHARPPAADGVQTRLSLQRFYRASHEIDGLIRRCVPEDQRARMGHLADFARVLGINDDLHHHQFGMCVRDRTFADRHDAAEEIPAELRSQEFLAAVSRDGGLAEAQSLIEAHNRTLAEAARATGTAPLLWRTLAFRSQFLTTPDCYATYGRFLVVVPGQELDRWVMFGIRTPEDQEPGGRGCEPARPVSLSVLSARRQAKAGEPVTQQIDYVRRFRGDGHIELSTIYAAEGRATNCLTCHKSVVNPIHPARVYDIAADGALQGHARLEEAGEDVRRTLTELNGWIRSQSHYLPFSTRPFYEPAAYGPPLACRPQRSHAEVVDCATAAGLDPADEAGIRTVEKSMACANCHAAGSDDFPALGPLNLPVTTADPRFPLVGELVSKMVMEGLMPPRRDPQPHFLETAAPASPHDLAVRHALLACLSREYLQVDPASVGPAKARGLLAEWLRSDRDYTAETCRKSP